MGATGSIRGLLEVVGGGIEEDGEKVAKGVLRTVKSTVSTAASVVTGEGIEAIHKDDDHDD